MLFTSRKLLKTLCPLLFCSIAVAGSATPTLSVEPSPIGLWRTVDDHTHKPRGIIRIYEQNGAFFGRIETSFDPEERKARCEKCTDDRKDAPVIGLVIMRGVKKRGSDYTGGEILDPETGYTYRCRFTLSDEGARLFVRGYLGLSILGRTQTWIRTEDTRTNANETHLAVPRLGTEFVTATIGVD
jgi:uncharacterized protein (DUF2147 family)